MRLAEPPHPFRGRLRSDASHLLPLLERTHAERFDAFRDLQHHLAGARELAAVIVDQDGFPVLHVVRVDASRSLPIGCVYAPRTTGGTWFYSTPDIAQWCPVSDAEAAAAEIRRALS